MQRTDYCVHLSTRDIGREVTLCGWVKRRRDLGALTFVDLRDSSGVIQLLFPRGTPPTEAARGLNREDVIAVMGTVAARSAGNINPEMDTGEIEVEVERLEIINRSRTPPFLIEGDGSDTTEETRLRFRYVDLRRDRMQHNLRLRHRVFKNIRDYFSEKGFLEIETPLLTKSTPEGARDFLVPSRISQGRFYALPQSPQLFKQLFMIGGIDRYFQLAKCFRDEDLRADRQPEFTQLDLEISFPRGQEEVLEIMEGAMAKLFWELFSVDISSPFPRLSHAEAINTYGTDKPDLRFGMEIHDISNLVKGGGFRIFTAAIDAGGKVAGINLTGCAGYSRSQIDRLEEIAIAAGARGLLWIKHKEEMESSLTRFLPADTMGEIAHEFSSQPGDLILILAGGGIEEILGRLRVEIAAQEKLASDEWKALWVTDFPLFSRDENGGITSEHHPFTSPRMEDVGRLEEEPLSVLSAAYDLVLNGTELGSGSIRIHSRELQERVFRVLGISPEDAQARFGFFLHALDYGAPPHAGFALGLDRLVMMLAGEKSLRDVIAFPKTATGLCPLTEAPMPVDPAQLSELGLKRGRD
ncbi:MAG: aspartate--tRNA ligase [Candidatus Bipolaricaulota bacterium]|nr:aspartate--tRNA ligase [Candidatus Bipolaricaulota bacterium]